MCINYYDVYMSLAKRVLQFNSHGLTVHVCTYNNVFVHVNSHHPSCCVIGSIVVPRREGTLASGAQHSLTSEGHGETEHSDH